MPRKDEIPATGDMPQPPTPRRIDATEKARQMMQPVAPQTEPVGEGGEPDALAFKKVTTRIPLEQFQWLKDEVKQYRKRNPKAPRVTIEGLVMVALDHLKDVKNLDVVITKYRS